jgi:hypothetical protein
LPGTSAAFAACGASVPMPRCCMLQSA